jgi:cobalt ECF transporter T component CbiQ/cobalamin biosynthesis protein CbiM
MVVSKSSDPPRCEHLAHATDGHLMHIPDGYLSPATCGVLGASMVPAWASAALRVRKLVTSRYVPLLALGAAYSFLVMMFNVPIPDGTTAHAAGAVLIAILLGPWAAVVAVSVALAIQALFFGDGGVLSFGANCFNMALVMPMVGYAVYRTTTRNVSLTAPRRAFCAGIAGYVGLNAAALCTAVELGVQPTLFHSANGTPLYAPFRLSQTIPTMMLAHLLVAGTVELILTGGVIAYLQRANLPILRINHAGVPDAGDVAPPRRLAWRWGALTLGVVALLTPLGLLASGRAFGEDAPAAARVLKHPLFNGYDFSHGRHPTVGYIASAFVGMAAIALVVVVVMRLLRRDPKPALRKRVISQTTPQIAAPARRTPEWLTRSEVGLCPCGCIGTRSKGDFLEKTLTSASNLMRQSMFSDDVSARHGFLQRLEPRVKLASMFLLVLTAAVVRNPVVLVALYGSSLVLAAASKLSLRFFVARVWLFIPVFTGIVVIPAMFSFITHGRIVVPLGSWFGSPVGLTEQGLTTAALIVMRVATSTSFVVLVTITTSWPRLLAALRALFVPQMFILVIGMAYRYLFHLLGSVSDMFTARKARTVGRERDGRRDRAFVAASTGALFGKAHALSEEVHMAMVSRGYRGDAVTLSRTRVRVTELALFTATVLLATTTIGVDRVIGR